MSIIAASRGAAGAGGSRRAALPPGRADVATVRRAPRRDPMAGLTVVVALPVPDRHTDALEALAAPDRLRGRGRLFAHTGEAHTAARQRLHHTGVVVPPPRRHGLVGRTARITRGNQ